MRCWLRVTALILSWLPLGLGATGAALPLAQDLAADARDMARSGAVMLLLFSQADCPWCERARREYLVPLRDDPAWRGRLVMRQIDIDSGAALTDFAGRRTSHRAFARSEGAKLAPTLGFYAADGRQRAEPIVGFRLADFYGAYIERALREALAAPAAP